jgi:plastocyanin
MIGGESMGRRIWFGIVAGLAVFVLTAAACSSNDNGASGSTGGGAQSSSAPTSTETSSGAEGEGGGGGGSPDLVAEDFEFSPTDVSASSGSTLTVKNDAPSTPHTFTVEGTKIDQSLDPDTEYHVKINLKPGTYDFHCTIHPQMTGTLTVN